MLDVMYEIPSDKTIVECLINEDVIEHKGKPVLLYEKQSA
jgi:ATP-dependent protease Clp ATPase subunit